MVAEVAIVVDSMRVDMADIPVEEATWVVEVEAFMAIPPVVKSTLEMFVLDLSFTNNSLRILQVGKISKISSVVQVIKFFPMVNLFQATFSVRISTLALTDVPKDPE